jgi:hypothetical protein
VDKPKKRAMKKHLLLAVSLSALVAYAVIVCVGYFHARAEIADEACGVDCLVQRVDALTKKIEALERTAPILLRPNLMPPFLRNGRLGTSN